MSAAMRTGAKLPSRVYPRKGARRTGRRFANVSASWKSSAASVTTLWNDGTRRSSSCRRSTSATAAPRSATSSSEYSSSMPGVRADSAPVSAGTSVAASALMIDAR